MQQSVRIFARRAILAGVVTGLAACGGIGSGDSGLFGRHNKPLDKTTKEQIAAQQERRDYGARSTGTTFFGLFNNKADSNVSVGVNKYLWRASLDVLNFLPIQSADPFTGVIVTGFGTPPGGGRAYRATIYVSDPALDARSLKVALVSKGGPVDAATARAVEDAILTRARQLRIQDGKL